MGTTPPPSPSSSCRFAILLALLLALGSVDASPAFRQITELLVKSQMRDGDPDFAVYYKEPAKPFLIRSSICGLYLRRELGTDLF